MVATNPPTPRQIVVMVIEDDEDVGRGLQRLLKDEGFRVLFAPRAAEALDTARVFADWVDLVLCDLNLPDMRGEQLATELLEILPRTARFAFLSGEEVAPGAFTLIRKPVRGRDLLARLREILVAPA